MSKRSSLRWLCSSVLMMLVISSSTPGFAADSPGLRLKGQSATAFFDFAARSVVQTQVYVAVSQATPAQQSGRSRSKMLIAVFSAAYPTSEPQPFIDAIGEATVGHEAFYVDPQLGEARLKTTLPVYDRVSQIYIALDVDLSWSAIGAVRGERRSSSFDAPTFTVKQSVHGDTRAATATGSIRNPDGFDYLLQCAYDGCGAFPAASAQVLDLKNGVVVIDSNRTSR